MDKREDEKRKKILEAGQRYKQTTIRDNARRTEEIDSPTARQERKRIADENRAKNGGKTFINAPKSNSSSLPAPFKAANEMYGTVSTEMNRFGKALRPMIDEAERERTAPLETKITQSALESFKKGMGIAKTMPMVGEALDSYSEYHQNKNIQEIILNNSKKDEEEPLELFGIDLGAAFQGDLKYNKNWKEDFSERNKQIEAEYHYLDEETMAEIELIAKGINAESHLDGTLGFFNKGTNVEESYKQIIANGEAAEQRLRKKGYSGRQINKWSRMRAEGQNQEFQEESWKELEAFAEEHPVLASAYSTAYKVATVPLDAVLMTEGAIKGDFNSGSAADTILQADEMLRSAVSEDIAEESNWGAWLYNVGMSGVDSAVAAVMPGGAYFLAADAATSTMRDLTERGLSTDEAFMGGIVAGVAEGLFEKVSIGNFKSLQEVSPASIKDVVKNVIKSTGVNASEEASTELANIIYDSVAHGDLSNYNQLVEKYIAQGMSSEDAKSKAFTDLALQVLEAGASGAVMGGGFGVTGSAIGYAKNYKPISSAGKKAMDSDSVDAILDAAKLAPQGTRPQQAYEHVTKKQNKGKNLTAHDIGHVAVATQDYIRENAHELNGVFKSAKTSEDVDALYNAERYRLDQMPVTPRSSIKALDADYKAAKSAVENYNTSGARAMLDGSLRNKTYSDADTVKTRKPTIGKTETGEIVSVSSIENIEDGNITVKTSEGTTQELNIRKDIKSVDAQTLWTNAAQNFPDAESAQAFIDNYDGGSIADYTKAFKDYYHLAATGMTLSQINEHEIAPYYDLSNKAQAAAVELGQKSISYQQGVVDLTARPKTKAQQLQVNMLDSIGKHIGMNVVVVDTMSKHDGFYRPGTNQIVVALDSSSGAILRTAGHETYHFVKEEMSDCAKDIETFVLDTLKKNKGEKWVNDRLKFYEKQGYKTKEAQTDELVADSLFDAFTSKRAVKDFATENQSLAKKLVNHIQKLLSDIKNIINKLLASGKYDEIKAWQDDLASLEKLNNMFLDVLDELAAKKVDNTAKTKNTAEAVKSTKHNVITKSDVNAAQSIGRKSINSLSPAELNSLSAFAKKYWNELGAKSPFFRAWFGDWRESDKTPSRVVKISKSSYNTETRSVVNKDMSKDDVEAIIKIDDAIFNDSMSYAKRFGDEKQITKLLSHIDEIISNAIYLDTHLSEKGKANKKGSATFMHYLYCPVEFNGAPFIAKITIEEYDVDSKRRAYNAQRIKMSSLPRAHFSTLNKDAKARNIRLQDDEITVADLFSLVKQNDKNFTPNPASKIVNPDGTPKVMYHGTQSSFTAFDKKKAKSYGYYGKGFYFTDSESHAGQYGNAMAVYLDVKNPLEPGKNKLTKNQLRSFLEAVAENEDYDIWNYGTEDISEIIGSIYKDDAFAVLQDVNATAIGDLAEAISLFNSVNGTNYDGVITPTETVVYGPTQIKSATDNIGTFDKSNPDIRYSTKRDADYMTAVNNGDMETAQKMVDEAAKATGYTYKLFHQTENDFTVFDTNHKGAGTGDYETPFGIFMKPTDSNIGLKGQKQMPIYAKIENPLVVHNRESLMRELKDAETVTTVQDKIKEANSDYKSRVEQAGKDLQNYLIEYRKAHPDEPRSDIYKDKGFNEIYDREDSLIEEWTAAVDELALEAKTAITEYLKNNGYDGVIIEEDVGSFGRKTKTYIALDNTQVKSSDPVTYDNNGNVIPLSKRFNEAEEDIRYSVKRAVDDNGNVYENTVVLDTNIFDKKKTRDWGKILQRFVYNNLVGKEVVLTDENNQEKVIQFAKGNERAKKDGAKNAHRVIDKLARKKDMNSQLAVAHSIEIISVMKPTEQKNDHSHQWLDENGWDYYKVILMQRNGKLFEATINVAKAKDGRNILYDINKIKEIGDGVVFSKTESSQRNSHINSDFDDEIVTQNKEFVNYSLKRESSISEEASNYILDTKEYREVLGILERRFNTLGKVKLSPKAIDRYAGRLLQKSNSNYSREQLTERLTALFDFIANSREVTWEEVTGIAANIAKDMLTESQTLDRSMQQEYADVLKMMRESRVYISPEVRAEINHNFGSLEAFRRRLGSKLKITVTDESAVPLDVFWRELAENRPEMFEEDTNYLDMPSKLVDFFEMTSPQYINPYNIEMDMDEAAYDLALQIYDEYFNIPEVKTEAQKYAAKLEMLRGRYNAKIKEIHNNYKERVKEIRTELKAENKNQIAVTKELYRRRNENYRNKQKETRDKQKLRAQIYRSAQNLTDKLVNPTDQKHIPQELISAVNDFCKAINESGVFSPEKTNKLRRAFKNIAENSADPDANLSTMYNEEIDEMLEQLHDAIAGRRLGELNVNELARVKIAASYFTHIVAMSNRTFSDNIKENLLDLQSNAIVELDKISPDRKRIKTEIQKGLLKPVTFFELLESPTLMKLYENIRQGEGKWYRTVALAKKRRQETAKKYNYKSWKNDKVTFKPERLDGEIILSVEEALAIYATANREQGVEHIRLGGIVREESAKKKLNYKEKAKSVDVRSETIPITVNDMVEITSQLTKEQKAYANDLIEFMSKDMAALGNEVSMRLFGIKKFNEKKYFPLKSASNFIYSKPAVENDARIKHMSMTKRTVPKANNPVVIGNFTETVMNHCNDMALYNAFCLPLEDFNRVYNFKTQPTMFERPTSIKQKIDRAFGTKANGYIKQLLTDINGGVTQQAGAGFVNKMILLAKKNAVFGSLSVAVQQPSAVARAFLYVDPRYFVQSTFSKRDWNELKTYAPVAGVKEMGYFDTNIGRQAVDWMSEDGYDNLKEKAFALFKDKDYRDDKLSFLPSYMDQISWGHIWNAVKKETAHNNPDMDKKSEEFLKLAGERFTYVIDRTQVYDSVFARSEWMRSKDTGVKVVTAFMSEPLTNYNMLYSATVKARHGDKKFAAKAVSAYIVSVAFNSILKSLVTAGRDDDEDKSYWEKYLSDVVANFIDEPFGMIPYLKDFVSLMQGYDSSRMDTQVLADLVKTVQTVSDSDKTPYEKVKSVFGTFGIALGVPFKNLWRDSEMVVRTVEKIFKGEFEPTTEQGIINAIKEEIGTDTPTAYEQVVEAYLNSDDEHYNKVYDNLIDSKSEKAIETGIKSAAKDKFQSGEITEVEATRILTEILELSDNEAYWIIAKWSETANGVEYAKYNNFSEAVRTGDDLKDVINDYLDHGVTKKALASQITKTFKQEYIELYRTDKAEASALRRRLLDAYVALGYDRDDKADDIADWLE